MITDLGFVWHSQRPLPHVLMAQPVSLSGHRICFQDGSFQCCHIRRHQLNLGLKAVAPLQACVPVGCGSPSHLMVLDAWPFCSRALGRSSPAHLLWPHVGSSTVAVTHSESQEGNVNSTTHNGMNKKLFYWRSRGWGSLLSDLFFKYSLSFIPHNPSGAISPNKAFPL